MTLCDELRDLFGPSKISVSPETIAEHSTDRWNFAHPPDVVVFAESHEEVVQLMKFAQLKKVPVTTRGAGVGYVGGCVPVHGGIALSLARMTKVLEINPADGVVVTQPGVILADLQGQVRDLGWYYPPDPASLKECSIGGTLATNAGGPRCLKYGVTKNYVLGLKVVLASGETLELGSRCHKNKTGFDLVSLLVGSEGMLGIITEATLRIIPHPQTRAMLTTTFSDFPAAARAVQEILNHGHLPSALEITDAFTLNAARSYLSQKAREQGSEVNEAQLPPGDAHLIVEIDGRIAAVANQLSELAELLQNTGALNHEIHPDEPACEAVWQLRRDFSYSLRATGLTKLNEDIVVPRSRLVDLALFAEQLQNETGIPVACFGHAGDGNIHTNLMVENYDQPEIRQKADAALDRLFHWILEHDGVITGEHGVGLAKKPWIREALGESSYRAHQTLKKALDPGNLLNPGKFLDDLDFS